MSIQILVVDDEPDLELLVTLQFEERIEAGELMFVFARDGIEALETLEANREIDIVVSDINMPRMDGLTLLTEIKNRYPLLSTVFVSAYGDMKNIRSAMNLGAFDFITKPIDFEDFEITLEKTFAHVQQIKAAQKAAHLRLKNKLLEKQAQDLERLNADKDKFFSIMAHDLKAPFTPVLGTAELLMKMGDQMSPDQVHKMCGIIYDSGKRVIELLDNLLRWAQLETGRMKFQPSHLDLANVVNKNIDLLASISENKQITIKNELRQPIFIYADKQMLDTILRNLLTNALKFTENGGQVLVSAIFSHENNNVSQKQSPNPHNYVEISVSDTGVGLSEESMSKLFRIDTHHTTLGTADEYGTGLGLIICHDMVHKNGGEIWVESELGIGTSFTFTLPIDAPYLVPSP